MKTLVVSVGLPVSVPGLSPVCSICSPLGAPLTLVLDRSHTGPFAAVEAALLMTYDTSKGQPSEEFKALITNLIYSTKGKGDMCDLSCTVPRRGRQQQITGAISLRSCCDPAATPLRSSCDLAAMLLRSCCDPASIPLGITRHGRCLSQVQTCCSQRKWPVA